MNVNYTREQFNSVINQLTLKLEDEDNGVKLSYDQYIDILQLGEVIPEFITLKVLKYPSATYNKLILKEDNNNSFVKIFEKLWKCFYDLNQIGNSLSITHVFYISIDSSHINYNFTDFLRKNILLPSGHYNQRRYKLFNKDFDGYTSRYFLFNDDINIEPDYIKTIKTGNPCKNDNASDIVNQTTMNINNGLSECLPCNSNDFTNAKYSPYGGRRDRDRDQVNHINRLFEITDLVPHYNTNENM